MSTCRFRRPVQGVALLPVISVNELDPLRDEGLVYYRRLLRAGVSTVGRVVAGTCHGDHLLLGGVMPDVYLASLRDVSGFAKSVG